MAEPDSTRQIGQKGAEAVRRISDVDGDTEFRTDGNEAKGTCHSDEPLGDLRCFSVVVLQHPAEMLLALDGVALGQRR